MPDRIPVIAGFDDNGPAVCAFVPDASPVRVSCVWFAGRPAGDPLFARHADGSRSTLVAIWPSDRHGSVIADRAHEVTVAEWHLSAAEFSALRAHHQDWPLSAYDLVVFRRRGLLVLAPRASNLFAAALTHPSSPLASRVVATIGAEVEHLAAALRSAA